MEYTKDAVFDIHYNNIGRMLFKRKRLLKRKDLFIKRKDMLKKIKEFISENKFITIVVLSITTFVAIDIALVNVFMNLLITL